MPRAADTSEGQGGATYQTVGAALLGCPYPGANPTVRPDRREQGKPAGEVLRAYPEKGTGPVVRSTFARGRTDCARNHAVPSELLHAQPRRSADGCVGANTLDAPYVALSLRCRALRPVGEFLVGETNGRGRAAWNRR